MLESMEKSLMAGLDPVEVSKRRQGGMMVSYIEGHYVISTANRIFGFDGWQSAVKDLQLFETEKGYECVATVQLRVDCRENEWIVRTDVGTGSSSFKMGRDKCVKEAVTDAMKRAFRTFGCQFGNSLYDKENALHQGREDDHGSKPEPYTHEESGQVMQQFLHDLVNSHDEASWKKCCDFYKDDIKKLGSEDQAKMRTAALDRKKVIEKLKEGDK